MTNKKTIGLVTYGRLAKSDATNLLLQSFRKNGFKAIIIDLEQIIINLNQQNTILSTPDVPDLRALDVLYLRDCFKYMKLAINIGSYAKNNGVLVIDNNLLTEKYLINKVTDGFKLLQAGLPYPDSVYCTTLGRYKKVLRQLPYPQIIKHRSNGRGAKIYLANDPVDAENMLVDLNEQGTLARYLLQTYYELAVDYRILMIDGKILGAMERTAKQGEFRANYSLGGSINKAELTDEMIDFAQRSAKAVNTDFIAGVDLVYSKKGQPFILEVNRTTGFEGFMKSHKIDVPQKISDAIIRRLDLHLTKKE